MTPANGRVAAIHLKGRVDAEQFVESMPGRVTVPTTTIWRGPCCDWPKRELLFGESFAILEVHDGFAFGQSPKDDYCGYVIAADLGDPVEATHAISTRSTHRYLAADIKKPHDLAISFGSFVAVTDIMGKFARLEDGGFVPRIHLRGIDELFSDPVTVAELFLGSPYLWGGNSSFGLDCSGLVQAALLACGIACPGDSDQQEKGLGRNLPDSEATRRGDLLFWKGHVAIAVDADRIIHANGHSMSVAYEPIAKAMARIEAAGEGPVTSRKRL